MLIGVLAACTSTNKGSGETGTGTGGTGGTSGPVSTGGVFTLTSATEGDPSSAGTLTTTTSMTTSGTETSTGTSATGTTGGSSTGAVDVCPGLIADLSAALQADARCELLLRLDDSGALLGWHSACGPLPAMDTFDSKAALLATQCCAESGKLIGPGTSPFIYHQLPMPPQAGGVGIISNHLGAVLYDATIGIDAAGTIQTPNAWQGPEALGVGADCGAPFVFDATTYDLTLDGLMDPPPLSPLAMNLLHEAIAATALPKALGPVIVERTIALGYQEQFETKVQSYVVLFELTRK